MTDHSSDPDIIHAQLTAALIAVQRLQHQIVKLEMASDRFRMDQYRDLYQLQKHLPSVQRALKRLIHTTK
jgi:hypothetical protein